MSRPVVVAVLWWAVLPGAVAAQAGYRARVDVRGQGAGFHDVMLDSIPVADTLSQPGGGPMSPDGFAVQCRPAASHCTFFRPGGVQRVGLMTATAEVTAWGLGLTGLSVHMTGRVGLDVGTVQEIVGDTLHMQLINPDAEWYDEPDEFSLSAITRVDFGGLYEQALSLVADSRPRDAL